MHRNNLKYIYIPLLLSFVAILNGCNPQFRSSTKPLQEQKIPGQKLFAIKNVNIIPMTSENKIFENATVVIKDHKIVAINENVPDGAEILPYSLLVPASCCSQLLTD